MGLLEIDRKELTMNEVKELLNVGEEAVKSLLKRGKLTGVRHWTKGKAGNPVSVRNITTESVAEYIKEHENKGKRG